MLWRIWSRSLYRAWFIACICIYKFTGQGVNAAAAGVAYPGAIAGKLWDKAELRRVLQPVRDWQRDFGVQIYIGEFSAIRWAPNDSACRYLKDCIELFEEFGWDWSYHAFREWNGWSVDYGQDKGDTTPSKTQTSRENLLRQWYGRLENEMNSPAPGGRVLIWPCRLAHESRPTSLRHTWQGFSVTSSERIPVKDLSPPKSAWPDGDARPCSETEERHERTALQDSIIRRSIMALTTAALTFGTSRHCRPPLRHRLKIRPETPPTTRRISRSAAAYPSRFRTKQSKIPFTLPPICWWKCAASRISITSAMAGWQSPMARTALNQATTRAIFVSAQMRGLPVGR